MNEKVLPNQEAWFREIKKAGASADQLGIVRWNSVSFRQREARRIFGLREKLFSEEAAKSLLDDHEHLGVGFEKDNLFEGFRNEAVDFFAFRQIKWHGKNNAPDTSIVASQVSCVNCLFRFISFREGLAGWLQQLYPELLEVLPIDSKSETPLTNGQYPFLSFEWIGEKNYLNEPAGTRGAFQTNADAVLRFLQQDGRIHVILVEWKYCESDLGDFDAFHSACQSE